MHESAGSVRRADDGPDAIRFFGGLLVALVLSAACWTIAALALDVL